jgi:hypothetical protein
MSFSGQGFRDLVVGWDEMDVIWTICTTVWEKQKPNLKLYVQAIEFLNPGSFVLFASAHHRDQVPNPFTESGAVET